MLLAKRLESSGILERNSQTKSGSFKVFQASNGPQKAACGLPGMEEESGKGLRII